MSEIEYRFREMERRIGKVEDATATVPVMAHDLTEIKSDIKEIRDETASMRRAFYSVSVSLMTASLSALFIVERFFS